jgi:hypothetical protein
MRPNVRATIQETALVIRKETVIYIPELRLKLKVFGGFNPL